MGNDYCQSPLGGPPDRKFKEAVARVKALGDDDDSLFQYMARTWRNHQKLDLVRACFDSYWNPQEDYNATFEEIFVPISDEGEQDSELVRALPFLCRAMDLGVNAGDLRFLHDEKQWVPLFRTEYRTNARLQETYQYVRDRLYHLFECLLTDQVVEYSLSSNGQSIRRSAIEMCPEKALRLEQLRTVLPQEHQESLPTELPEVLFFVDLVALPDSLKPLVVAMLVLPASYQTRDVMEEWTALPLSSRWIYLAILLLHHHSPIDSSELTLLINYHCTMMQGSSDPFQHRWEEMVQDGSSELVGRVHLLHSLLEAPLYYISLLQHLLAVDHLYTYQLLCGFTFMEIAFAKPHSSETILSQFFTRFLEFAPGPQAKPSKNAKGNDGDTQNLSNRFGLLAVE